MQLLLKSKFALAENWVQKTIIKKATIFLYIGLNYMLQLRIAQKCVNYCEFRENKKHPDVSGCLMK